MPSPTTALQIITDSLMLSRAVGVDQTLTALEVSDSLRAFNDLVEILSTEKLAVYGLANQTFNTIANQKAYTIGPSGDWNTVRPVRINPVAYSSLPVGASQPSTYPCTSITQEQYNLIGVKDQTQEYPDFFLYVNTPTLGTVTLWPVPSQVTPITFSIDRVLTQSATAATAISFPPGYAHMFKYNLAPMLAPYFGKQVDQEVKAEAVRSLADIKRANKVTPVMQYDAALRPRNGYVDWRGY